MGVIDDFLLGEGADRQSIAIATEDAGGVFQRFTATELGDAGIEIHGLAAKASHGHLKAHPGAGRRFGEDQPQHTVTEIDPPITGLQLRSQLKQRSGFLGAGVSRGQEITASEGGQGGCNASGCGHHHVGSKDSYQG